MVTEIEHINGDYRLRIDKFGIVITKLKEDAASFYEQKMLPEKFWEALSTLLKSLHADIAEKEKEIARVTQLALMYKGALDELRKQEPEKKFIPVGSNKKQMFVAGVTFGKNMRK